MGEENQLIRIFDHYGIEHRCLTVSCPKEYYRELCQEFECILRCGTYHQICQWSFTELYIKHYELFLEILKSATTCISGPLKSGKHGCIHRFKIKIGMDNLNSDLYGYLLNINDQIMIAFINHPLGPTMGHEVCHVTGILIHSKKVYPNSIPNYEEMDEIVKTTGLDFYEEKFHKFFDIIFQELYQYVGAIPNDKNIKVIHVLNNASEIVENFLLTFIPKGIIDNPRFKLKWELAYGQMLEDFNCDFIKDLFQFLTNNGMTPQEFEAFKIATCNTTKVIRGARYQMNMWNSGLPDELRNIVEYPFQFGSTTVNHSEGIANHEYMKNNYHKFQVSLSNGQTIRNLNRKIANSSGKLFRIGHAKDDFFKREFKDVFEFAGEYTKTQKRFTQIFNDLLGMPEEELIHIESSC